MYVLCHTVLLVLIRILQHFELGQAILSRIDGAGWQLPEGLSVVPSPDPLLLWSKFAVSYNVQEGMIKEISDELDSSVRWQSA